MISSGVLLGKICHTKLKNLKQNHLSLEPKRNNFIQLWKYERCVVITRVSNLSQTCVTWVELFTLECEIQQDQKQIRKQWYRCSILIHRIWRLPPVPWEQEYPEILRHDYFCQVKFNNISGICSSQINLG